MKRMFLRVSIVSLFSVVVGACAQPIEIPPKKSLQLSIKSMVGVACQNSSQCQTIGFGIAPCGGFSNYLVYSKTDTDVQQLKSNVERFNQMQKIINKKNGVVGTCQHIPAPKTYCSANQCIVGSSNTVL